MNPNDWSLLEWVLWFTFWFAVGWSIGAWRG